MRLLESLAYKPAALSFGTSGLRGLVTDMTDLECYINAAGFLRFLQQVDGVKPGATIYLAGDLRESTDRIMQVMQAAIEAADFVVVNCGKVPTPAVAYYALQQSSPCIMVTGSHIPADRNGIKFYKTAGEVLKADEAAILQAVAEVREELYGQNVDETGFTSDGSRKDLPTLPALDSAGAETYINRFKDVFPGDCLAGEQVVVYQQSAVGRDILVTIFENLGAEVVPIDRLDYFLSIDTENVTAVEKERFHGFAECYPTAFATISTDGDSDRPFVIDETGEFHRGDVLGCVVAKYLGAKFAAVPISANDAADEYCQQEGIELVKTRIGSPYIITAMDESDKRPAVAWEVNGGFMTGSPISLNDGMLQPLPTRDAALPIVCALVAAKRAGQKVSELFGLLPRRFTGAALVDDVPEPQIQAFRQQATNLELMAELVNKIFANTAFGEVKTVDATDGLRVRFTNNEVLHFRASGNAPQCRVYSNADSQDRADELAETSIQPGGYIEQLLQALVTN